LKGDVLGMKNKLLVLVSVLLLAGLMSGAVYAAGDNTQIDVYDQNQNMVKSIVFAIGVPEYYINGQSKGVKMDVSPFINNGRTFVPVRYLGNALGLDDSKILWDSKQRKAVLKGINATAEMTIGVKQIITNGIAKDIDAAPMLKPPGRTFLPARYIAEALGYEVGWDAKNQIVKCWPKGEPEPAVPQEIVNQIQDAQAEAKKPEPVKQLEKTLGIKMSRSESYEIGDLRWGFWPPREVTMANKDNSYYRITWDPDGTIYLNVCWDAILPDIYHVKVDLSPMEKVLKMKFPGQDEKINEILAKAEEMAEYRKANNGFKRMPLVDYFINNQQIRIQSGEDVLAGMIIFPPGERHENLGQ